MPSFVGLAAAIATAPTQLALPNVFGSGMVLQREIVLPIWGTTVPGRTVTVKLQNQTKSARAGLDGRWMVRMPKLKPQFEGLLSVSDGIESKSFIDVCVGDVYLCSGQSNMEWPLSAAKNGPVEVKAADYSSIRLFEITKNAAKEAPMDVTGKWQACTPASAANFSAVGYYFGRSMYESEKVPIGLIDSTWGGTPAESWTPLPAFKTTAVTSEIYRRFEAAMAAPPAKPEPGILPTPAQLPVPDNNSRGFAEGWHKDVSNPGWTECSLPRPFSAIPKLNINGQVWFRTTVTLPAAMKGQPLSLHLGPIDDMDTTYVNGEKIGGLGAETPNVWAVNRVYQVPAKLTSTGALHIAVRVYDGQGDGGFSNSKENFHLSLGTQKLPLPAMWQFRIETGYQKAAAAVAPQNSPSYLWNGMIQPIVPYGLKGAIWYQGESNAGRAKEYQTLFPTMIQGWRTAWGQGDIPFFFVQLANFMKRQDQPSESGWAELREAQTMTLRLKNTGMAVIIDIGEADDIHPRNKQDVGERLAMSARNLLFPGKQPAGNSPLVDSTTWGPDSVRIKFKNGNGLKTSDGRPPTGFAIRGSSGGFKWATARLEGESVVVFNPSITNPLEVRYAWADNPDCNVVNRLGLPMSPFRVSK